MTSKMKEKDNKALTTMKEKDNRALTTQRPTEVVPRMQNMERLFDRMVEEFWRRPFPALLRPEHWWPTQTAMTIPAVDVYDEKDNVVIKAEIPGFSKEHISVQVADSMLTIKGEKQREEEVNNGDYYQCERSFGSFTRDVALPCDVKADQVKASCKNGVLEVRIPKAEAAKKKVIPVEIE